MATKKNPEDNVEKTDSAAPAETWTPTSPKRRRRGFSGLLFLILLAVSAYAYYLYNENQDLKNPERQIARVVAGISKHIIVPADETPGIFAIDPTKSKEPFFKNAQEGDILVVYRTTNQAFIWSPSRNILVNAGVLVVNPESQKVPAASTTPKAQPTEAATGTAQ